MGLVYVFLFLNVKDGPSRFRMASYYAVSSKLWGLVFLSCASTCASLKSDVYSAAVCP